MLKRSITYEDYDGEKVTEVYYFNLSKPELLELEVEHKQGFGKVLQLIVDTKDNKELIKVFKSIIMMAYGVRSEDGTRFIKTDQVKEEFSQTEAYNALFMELATDDNAAVSFLTGILPRDMSAAMDVEDLKQKTAEKLGIKTASSPLPPTS